MLSCKENRDSIIILNDKSKIVAVISVILSYDNNTECMVSFLVAMATWFVYSTACIVIARQISSSIQVLLIAKKVQLKTIVACKPDSSEISLLQLDQKHHWIISYQKANWRFDLLQVEVPHLSICSSKSE